jgi:hypothetical protein
MQKYIIGSIVLDIKIKKMTRHCYFYDLFCSYFTIYGKKQNYRQVYLLLSESITFDSLSVTLICF